MYRIFSLPCQGGCELICLAEEKRPGCSRGGRCLLWKSGKKDKGKRPGKARRKDSGPKPSHRKQGIGEGVLAGSGVWKSFRDEFKALVREQETLQAEAHDCSLRAYGDYGPSTADLDKTIKVNDRFRSVAKAIMSLPPNERPEAWKLERGQLIQDGVVPAEQCKEWGEKYLGDPMLTRLIERRDPSPGPQYGEWTLSNGPNENFKADFEALATDAGIALGSPPGTEPYKFWLHSLFLNLWEHKSPELFGAEKNGSEIIKHVCIASSTYCARLAKEARIQEAKAHKAAVEQKVESKREGKVPIEESRSGASRKGDPKLLEGKDLVTRQNASQYLDNTKRHVRNLLKNGQLTSEGQGHNKKITTESLRRYLPSIKTEQKGINRK